MPLSDAHIRRSAWLAIAVAAFALVYLESDLHMGPR